MTTPRRRLKLTMGEREAFLEALSTGEAVRSISERIGRDKKHFYRLRHADPEFRAAWEQADEKGREVRADFADHKGETWALEEGADTQMRLAWLRRNNKAWHAPTYQRVEHTGPGGGALEVTHPDIAQAIERFTASVLQLAERKRAELPPGDTSG